MTHKTTAKHFEIFKAEFARWVEIFGLKDWDVAFYHEDTDKWRAHCDASLRDYMASISLATKWTDGPGAITDGDIRLAAFHEACELLLVPLKSCALTRFLHEHEVDEADHRIVRTLENVLWPKYETT